MSSKIEVSRELLERCIRANDEAQPSQLHADLKALLDAHVVERQPLFMKPQYLTVQGLWIECKADEAKAVQFYRAPPELAELQATIAQLTAERDIWRKGSEDNNVRANSFARENERLTAEIERLKGGQGEPVACTSCDGSGEHIDAIGDWRGYCSCPAGIALKNKPVPTSVAPDGWRLVPLHPTMDMLDALMEWKKVGNVNAYNNILNAAPACIDKVKELNQ